MTDLKIVINEELFSKSAVGRQMLCNEQAEMLKSIFVQTETNTKKCYYVNHCWRSVNQSPFVCDFCKMQINFDDKVPVYGCIRVADDSVN